MSDDERVTGLIETVTLLVQWSRNAEEKFKRITENQVVFAQAMASLAESQARFSAAQAELAEEQTRLVAAQADTEFKLAALTDAQIRTETVVAELSEQMKALATRQERTDMRLDEFINTVREKHEGESPQQT